MAVSISHVGCRIVITAVTEIVQEDFSIQNTSRVPAEKPRSKETVTHLFLPSG